jgi:ribonucleoside-diphosphate reductase alpha chain
MPTYQDIEIDYSRDNLFDEHGLLRLKESYLKQGETSPQERFAFVSRQFGSNLAHAQRLYNYASKHWLSYSTPILAFGKDKKALPISCFLPYLSDTREGLVNTLSEVNWLSMLGGGIGVGVGIRASDDKSTGVMSHMKTYDSSSLAYRQGKTRRGSYAMYLDISHPDIIPFLEMRKPTGDANQRCFNLHNAVNIPDAFMEIIERCMVDPNVDDTWNLIDPFTKEIRNKISAKELWQRILELRMQTGEPYIHYIDTSNRELPLYFKEKNLTIKQSNLCVVGETLITILLEDETIHDIQIKDLNNYLVNGLVKVLSFNIETNECSFKPILKFACTSEKAKIMRITAEDGRFIECTSEHKIFTKNRGYVMAKDLQESDELVFD